MTSPTVQKVINQLKKSNLSMEDRVALITVLLEKLGAFPIGDMITFTETGISINGKDLDNEQYVNFREACVGLKDNYARRVINEQLKYKATLIGIHESKIIEELFFSKVILWFINEENLLLEKLSTLG